MKAAKVRNFASVWDAIEPDGGAAASLKAKSEFMVALSQLIRRSGWTQKEAATRCSVTQPRIADLMRGRSVLARHAGGYGGGRRAQAEAQCAEGSLDARANISFLPHSIARGNQQLCGIWR